MLVRMVTTAGVIDLELDAARAPVTVENFLMYAERGSYDRSIFHRCIPGFVAQGGGYTKDMADIAKREGGGENRDPKIMNEWMNGLKNVRGTIAMARDTEPDSATREFYINVADNARLDIGREVSGNAGYAVFGRVVKGMDVVDAIVNAPTREVPDLEMKDVPLEPVEILSVVRMGR